MSAANRIPPGQQLAAPGKWPIVGERTAAISAKPWTVEVCGLVGQPLSLAIGDLPQLPQTTAVVDVHCVTRWSQLDQEFRGVLLADLLQRAAPLPAARFVSFVARSSREHSTSLPLAEAIKLNALIATHHAGQPLAEGHGGPVRVVVPGRYFYKSLKWLIRIELLAEDRLGYWEKIAGYHNEADPWREQRYIAPDISRAKAAEVIDSRNFLALNLRGIDVRDRDLSNLRASGALLRDADFRGATLITANFRGANLSNARLQGADLRGASFQDADVEGADFCGADLRGADFRGASLLGVTFVGQSGQSAAKIDAATRFDPDRLDDLFPQQAEFVLRLLRQASPTEH
jgi:DMSO/TMAO reductase YedYZ molybdopterin-dependent catalytic subunit